MKFFRQIVTDYDNQTYDTGRSAAVFLIISMTIMEAISIYQGHEFRAMEFGGGVAAVLGALGLAIAGDNHRRP